MEMLMSMGQLSHLQFIWFWELIEDRIIIMLYGIYVEASWKELLAISFHGMIVVSYSNFFSFFFSGPSNSLRARKEEIMHGSEHREALY